MNKMSCTLAALFAVTLPVCAGAVVPVSAPERLGAAADSIAAAVRAGDYNSAENGLSAMFSGGGAAEAPVVYLENVSLPERSARAVPEPARFEKFVAEDKAVPAVSAPAAVDGAKADSDKAGEKEDAGSSAPAPEADVFGALAAVCLIAVALSGGTAALFFLCMLVLAC